MCEIILRVVGGESFLGKYIFFGKDSLYSDEEYGRTKEYPEILDSCCNRVPDRWMDGMGISASIG